MSVVSCRICRTNFYVKPHHQTKGWGKYCSNKCKYAAQKTGCIKTCNNCSKPIYKNKKDQANSLKGRFFCNKSCQAKWRNSRVLFGSNHGNWQGGKSSYRTILKRTKIPQVCARCATSDTRILAVHHKDKDRTNNDSTNLLWMCHNCHYLIHHYPEESLGYIVPPRSREQLA